MAFTKKTPLTLALLGASLLAFSSSASAQAVKVDQPKIDITIQKTPRFTVSGPKEKRDTQKFWIEVEVEFEADQANPKEDFISELEIKYFITMTPKTGEVRKVYTLGVSHVNIPKNEKAYSVAYMSPTTIAKIIGKDKVPSKADIDVAVEIRSQGTLVAGDATKSASKKWWNTMPQAEGMVLNKSNTPFATLWVDRYVEEKAR